MTHDHSPAAPTPECCAELARYEMSRRGMLTGALAAGALGTATSLFGQATRQVSFANGPSSGNVLVVLSLRGGIDGMGVVVPHGDPAYYQARPGIGVPRSSLVAQDAMFGLHPAMQPVQWMFDRGELAAVHAVGMDHPNRSHFAAIEEVEDADPGTPERRGWINRMVGLDTDEDPLEAVQLSSTVVPISMTGPGPGSVAVPRLGDLSLAGAAGGEAALARRKQLETLWDGETGLLGDAARRTFAAVDAAATARGDAYAGGGVTYPAGDLAAALADTARLVRAPVGTEVVAIDYGSWDLHVDYGTATGGAMTTRVRVLAEALDAFFRDLGELRSRVTVVTISEFGRRVAQNGSGGLDHGWGNMMLVAGGGVKGGKYYGTWPGLGTGSLVDGDLKVTTDYRQVLAEVVHRRFDRSTASVFPGFTYSPLGLMS